MEQQGPSSRPAPPPVPPRQYYDSQQMSMPNNGMYGGGGFGAPMSYGVGYGGYGGGYGGMGGGMYGNHYNNGMMGGYGHTEGNFSRLAEESSRGAFQSIEAVVNAVTSVSNMLSSTHNAVYSSFRAVIGVVDQFSRLKGQFTGLMASLALFRFVQKLWRWLLVALRLKPANYASDQELAWTTAQAPLGADLLVGGSPGTPVNWPALFFWVVALGFPYLIYKCVTRMVENVEKQRVWATGPANHYNAEALFDFEAQNAQELSVMAGERLRIAPKEQQPKVRGWLLASTSDGQKIGLVPINYVKIVGKQSSSPPPADAFEKSFRPPLKSMLEGQPKE
ncbi:unnamed protein product, partial [Mesorhabditis spiculigera]